MDEPRDAVVVDWDQALARCLGRPDLLDHILALYGIEKPRRLADLDDALAAGDHRGVRHAAHELKGMASVLAAARLREAALALERAAGGGDVGSLATLRDALAREIARLDAEIARRAGREFP